MDGFSLKNRIMKEIDVNYRKLGELFENIEKGKNAGNRSLHVGGGSHLLMDQYRRSVSRIFSELEMQENRLRIANTSIVQSFEKEASKARDTSQYIGNYDRMNYFKGRFRMEVDAIISRRSRLKEEFRKMDRTI